MSAHLMVGQLNAMMNAILNDDDLIPSIAKVMGRLRNELVKEGFTEAEALEIITKIKLHRD